MSLFGKLGGLFSLDDDIDDDYEDDDFDEPEVKPYMSMRRSYSPPPSMSSLPTREPPREPLARERERERERENVNNINVIPLRGNDAIRRITEKFQIVVIEPKAFDECPKLVDSLKKRKPVIINLEFVESDARKIFDFLSGATYALNGNVQKIAQNIFVFLPENVDVQTGSEPQSMKYGKETTDKWQRR